MASPVFGWPAGLRSASTDVRMAGSDKPSNPEDGVLIDREEWDFQDVPDSELLVCRLWEYARESTSIRSLWERTWEASRGNLSGASERRIVHKEFGVYFHHLGRAAILFQEGIYGFEGSASLPGFHSPFPNPWQRLSNAQRRILCDTANWDVHALIGIPPFRRAQLPHVNALANFKPKAMKAVFGKERISAKDFFHAGDKLRGICPNHLSLGGTELLAIEIEWGDATNEELVAAFTKWLKENDPPGVRRPDRRGKKLTDLRAALDRLGMMRLLHSFTRAEMRRKVPAAENRFASRDWYRDRKRAKGTFRELFHFLPANERPRTWATKGSGRR